MPFPPGGGVDGTLVAQHLATSPADGHRLFYGTPGQPTINPILMRDLASGSAPW